MGPGPTRFHRLKGEGKRRMPGTPPVAFVCARSTGFRSALSLGTIPDSVYIVMAWITIIHVFGDQSHNKLSDPAFFSNKALELPYQKL